ncbi:MAG: hypothetical protein AAGD25_00015 [Cyanobacteria bacterium P01_F01_bin.150]
MPDYPSISKQHPPFPDYLNFQVLRDIGITRLQALSSDLWTDYNLHDPGVTILEVLCYAITDLGYRNNFDIQDLLALNPQDQASRENNFFTPDEVLTCNPVTDLDLRKRIIDIPGVRNVQFEKVGVPDETRERISIPYEPAIEIDLPNRQLRYAPLDPVPAPSEQADEPTSARSAPRLHPRGLYTVCLDLDSQYRKNTCGNLTRDWSSTIDQVKQVLCSTRSLCEDIYDIELLGEEEIGLCTDIQLESGADAEDVLVDIYVRVQAFLSPRLRFYTLQELVQKGKSPAEIFAGRPMSLEHSDRPYWNKGLSDRPYPSHGFIDTEELAALKPPTRLQTSDLYQVLLDVPGVAAVQKLSISSYINNLRQSPAQPWTLQLTEGYRPVLGIQHSIVRLSLGDLPTPVNTEEVTRRYYEQQAAYIKAIRDPYELDLAVPKGRHYNLADYYSIHHEFPLTYGISEAGLPDSASALRKVQAQQLKGYLVFFDQLLANYLAQLSQVRELFSWDLDRPDPKTYFTQAIDFPGVENILKGMEEAPPQSPSSHYLTAIAEDPATYRDRRSRFLDHILARFAESFTDYVLLNYQLFEEEKLLSREQFEQQTIEEKTRFFRNYPLLSHDRFRAFNYCACDNNDVWNTDNVSGFQRRMASLLGIQNSRRRDLNHYHVEPVSGSVLSVRCSASGPSLVTAAYKSKADALAHREELLRFLLHECFYARLTYESFYQYGLEVRCSIEGEAIAFLYDRYFSSRLERQQTFNRLLAYLNASLKQEDGQLQNDLPISLSAIRAGDLWHIQLIIPHTLLGTNSDANSGTNSDAGNITIAAPIRFISGQTYGSESEANNAAGETLQNELLTAICQPQRYCGVVLLEDDGSQKNNEVPKAFPYYGYALKNAAGEVIAEPSLIDHDGEPLKGTLGLSINSAYRFSSKAARDLALQQWLCHIEANQERFEFQVLPDLEEEGKWLFKLVDLAAQSEDSLEGEFCSVEAYPTAQAAWDAATTAAESLRYRSRYSDRTASAEKPSIGITDGDGTVLMESSTDETLDRLFRQFNNLECFLHIEAVEVPVQDAVVIPFALPEPSSETTETTTQYRYQVRLERIQKQHDPTDGDQQAGAESTILLQSIDTYPDEETACDRFYQDVLAVLFEPGVICPIQDQETFGFRLLSQPRNAGSAVAENAQSYGTAEDRDAALETLLIHVRTARYAIAIQPLTHVLPIYTPVDKAAPNNLDANSSAPNSSVPNSSAPNSSEANASEDNSSESNSSEAEAPVPLYTGQIRANGTLLLEGQRGYLDPDIGWKHGDTLMELIQERQNFRTIRGNGVYGWELTNAGKDEIWARRYFSCEQDSTDAIDNLQRWVNDEGFYLVEHILLRPRSQQIVLAQEDSAQTAQTETAKTPETPVAAVLPQLTREEITREEITREETGETPTSHDQELDGFLPIIVRPNDSQYPVTDPDRLARQDPYSFWVTIVLPYWPKRFRNVDFRRFVERTLRMEAPAHIALKIAWVNVYQLHQFQTAYQPWLQNLAQYTCEGTACDLTRSLNQLLQILPRLRNVYPKATLHNCDQNRPGDSPILLNRTAIGTAND